MKGYILWFLLLFAWTVQAQETNIYSDESVLFREAENLFLKEQYAPAQKKFEKYIQEVANENDNWFIEAMYYHAVCAYELHNEDADVLLLHFAKRYPHHPKAESVYLKLGNLFYRNRHWKKTIEWYTKVNTLKLPEDEKAEFYFKRGYAHFMLDEMDAAELDFMEVVNVETQYQNPAIYYHSHILYSKGNYQKALEGFERIKDQEAFNTIVPYYITQILYKQKKYDEVILYAPLVLENAKAQKAPEIAHMLGDSYFQLGKYDEAIPYLIQYHQESKPTSEESYQLAYAYYKIGNYENAIQHFGKAARNDNALAQLSYYHMADSYEKTEEKEYARSSYRKASELDFDAEITEDALFKFAVLAYELSYNPYDEAINAFERYINEYPNSDRKQDAYNYLINVYMTTKNFEAALESLSKIDKSDIRLQSAYQMVVYNRGVELYANQKYPEAREHFKMVKTYPVSRELNMKSKYWIAESYYLEGRYLNAITNYKLFQAEPGAFSSSWHNLANYNLGYSYFVLAEENTGKYQDAKEYFKLFTSKAGPDDPRLNDAYLRAADAAFKLKEDQEAIKYYDKSIALNSDYQDYARLQKAMSLGYMNKISSKVSELNKLLQYHTNSPYEPKARFELGESYRVLDQRENALEQYQILVEQFPTNLLVRKSLFAMAQLYYKNNQLNLAENTYLSILNKYSNPDDCSHAILGLKEVYAAQNKLDEWEVLAKQYDCVDIDPDELENTMFEASIFRYWKDKDCDKIIQNADSYIKKYPKGSHIIEVLYYKAHCLESKEKIDESIVYYEQILTFPNNEFTEISLLQTAKWYYKEDRLQDALNNFSSLEKVATEPANKEIALIGQMRCFYRLNNFSSAKDYSLNVLKIPTLNDFTKTQAQLYLGRSYFELQDYTKAIVELKKVPGMTNGEMGAEAQFYVAQAQFNNGEYKKCEDEIKKLTQLKPSYDYWLGRGYILLSDNFLAQGNTIQAKLTLESIIKNYTNTTDGIIDTAQKKLQAILDAEMQSEEGKENRSLQLNLQNEEELDKIKDKKEGQND